ncbi:hypothetical protein B0H13DRAFT_1868455 [Mycena leptocephala]|nr:hypothetical protein B0H13DRAFT_1868455 [Mycena leptocephala]
MHARLSRGKWIARISRAHSLSCQHPAQELAPHKKTRQGAARTRTFAAATPAPAPDGAVMVRPIPVNVSGLRESRKERKSKYLEEEEERWKKGTGEKGVFERETRGMCVSKIFTEIRKEKKRKALRARWEDGREGKPGKSEERGGAEYALAPLFTPAEGGTRCGSRAGGGPSPP